MLKTKIQQLNEDSLDDFIDRVGRDPDKIATKGFSGFIPNPYTDCCFTFVTKDWHDMEKYGLPEHPVFFPRDPRNIDNNWTKHTYLSFEDTLKLFDKVPDKVLLVTPRQRCGWSYGNIAGDYASKEAWIAFAKKFLGIEVPEERKHNYVNPDMKGGTYFDGDVQVYEMPEENESTKNELELPILEGKTYRHAITNPRDKRYISGVDGYGPESDTERMGIRDQAYVDQEQIDNDLLNAFYDRINPNDDYDYIPPADVNTSIQPRFYMEPSEALDDVTEDELEAIDNGALETVDAGDPDELEHFDSEEDSVVVPIPEFEEETDEDTYY